VGLYSEEYNSFKGKLAYSRNFSEVWIGTQNHGKQKKARKQFSVSAQEKRGL